MRRAALIPLLLTSISWGQVGQNGIPLVTNFTPEDYGSAYQVFDVALGPDGRVHLACPEDQAVVHHDGERWEKSSLHIAPLSLEVDTAGRIWVGTSGDFGYVNDTLTGTEFVSVAGDSLADSETKHSFIVTRSTSHGVFFLSHDLLALWDGERVTTWKCSADDGFMDIEEVGADIFVLCGIRGLMHVENGDLVESEYLGTIRRPFDAIAATDDWLLGAWLSPNGLNWIRSDVGELQNLETVETRRGPGYISDMLITAKGKLVVSSSRGILIVDSEGGFQAWLDADHGLPSSHAYALTLDTEGGVWSGLLQGAVRFDPETSATVFGSQLGLRGTPLDLTRHEDALYCGTNEGLFVLSETDGRSHFSRVPLTPRQAFFILLSTPHGLFGCTDFGLFLIDEEGAVRLTDEQFTALVSLPEELVGDVETIALGGFDSLRLLRWIDEEGWIFEPPAEGFQGVDSLEFEGGRAWLWTQDQDLSWLPFDPFQFGAEAFGESTPVPGSWLGLAWLGNTLAVWNEERVMPVMLDHADSTTMQALDALEWPSLAHADRFPQLIPESDSELWLVDQRSLRQLRFNGDVNTEPKPETVWSSPFNIWDSYRDDLMPGTLWLSTLSGLVRLDTNTLRALPRRKPTVTLTVRGAQDRLLPCLGDAPLPALANVHIKAADGIHGVPGTEYRFRLGGLEEHWGPWSKAASKEYTHLPGGSFTLQVESGFHGQTLGVREIGFDVRPAWYAAWTTHLSAALLICALSLGLVRWRSAALHRKNESLESMVSERTRKLEDEQRQVQEHTTQLGRMNVRLIEALRARDAADESRQEMQTRLELAERLESLGTVAGGIAHDFNNYLTAIQGYAELTLADPHVGEQSANNLRALTDISHQAADLCASLLSLAGRTPLVRETLNLSDLIHEIEPLLHSSVEDRALLRMETATELPSIDGDLVQIRRALVNLVLNAAEACRSDGRIVVRTGTRKLSSEDLARLLGDGRPEAGLYAFIEVEDNGSGMSTETRQHIFNPFYSTKMVGRGLGLITVFRVASAHHGAISLKTTPGEGTSIALYFLCTDSAVPPAQRVVEEDQEALEGLVLIVDDDDAVRELSARLCDHLGLETETAHSGQAGLEALASADSRIDVVLLDVSMPGMTGLELHAVIRKTDLCLPIVLTSGYAESVSKEALDAHTSFLAKPYKLAALGHCLRQALSSAYSDGTLRP